MARTNNDNKDNKTKAETKTKETSSDKKGKSEPTKNRKRGRGDDNDGDDEEDIMDEFEYKKFLNKLFPSKHLSETVEKGERLKRVLKKDIEDKEDEEEENGSSSNEGIEMEVEELPVKKSKKNRVVSKSKVEKFADVIEDTEDEDGDDESVKKKPKNKTEKKTSKAKAGSSGGGGNYNIIFTIGGEDYNEEDDEYEEEDESDWEDDEDESEDEDASVSSVTDSSDEDEDESEDEDDGEVEEDEEEDEYEEEDVPVTRGRSKRIAKKSNETTKIEESSNKKNDDTENPVDVLNTMKKLCAENSGNKLLQESMKMGIDHYQSKVDKVDRQKERKEQKQKDKNSRIFKKLLRNKNKTNDYTFFDGLEKEKQIKLIKEVREVNKVSNVETPYRIGLLETNIPHKYKSIAFNKLESLKYMEPGSGEFYKIKNWIDTFMRIPFDTYKTLPVNITDGVEKCHDFMENAQKTLDDAVYGLDDAKMQIMQMLGQLVTNPQAIGTAIAIKGPMGTGKTTLVKEGISKILDRPFAFLALGGATDSSFLEGHSYTYEGSVWGKIVQILLDSKCMNPVIYFDELDKISDTPKGEEIAGILTHLTDTTQNSQFHDKYFSEVDFDLSKCLFIFSYNDEHKVNPILRDRMYRIQTKGYDVKEKVVISNNHVLPKIREQVKFSNEDVVIPEETIRHVVTNYCDKEHGVRNLKRCLEIIHTKVNLYRLMKPGTNLFKKEMTLDVSFPLTVTTEVVDKLLKRNDGVDPSLRMMYL
jgi:ATP-dependent Lon protease|uniref:ATPase AAA-type core domain-containing protein n=1 Tax=viral metagenome TaxID=1070528 RepID=A0A6C0IM94_9ZZZZ